MYKVRIFLVVASLLGLFVGYRTSSVNTDIALENDIKNETSFIQTPISTQDGPLESSVPTKEIILGKPSQTSESTRKSTDTVYPTQAMTVTSKPTLSFQGRHGFYRNLYWTNGGCELPCLWGLAPGAELDDVIDNFFKYHMFKEGSLSHYPENFHIMFQVPDDINVYDIFEWNIGVSTRDGIIQNVELGACYLKQFNEGGLEWLLRDLGNPASYELRVFFLDRPNAMYEIALYYPQKGIRVTWREIVENVENIGSLEIHRDNYTAIICPKNYDAHYDSPGFATRYTLPRLYTWIPGNNPITELKYPLTSANSDADLDHFYDTYFDTDEIVCFTYYGEY